MPHSRAATLGWKLSVFQSHPRYIIPSAAIAPPRATQSLH